MKFCFLLVFSLFYFQKGFSQIDSVTIIPAKTEVIFSTVHHLQQDYKLNNAIDIPLTILTTGYTLYGFSKIYSRESTPEFVILALNPANVNRLDRRVTGYRSIKAKDASDKLFYGSMPLPLLFLLDKKMRKDAPKLGLLYLQAVSSFGSMYASSAMIADRFRPYTYNPNEDLGKRRGGGGKNSFFAGHPGMVATVTFFSAKVYADYHPEMRNKWILYTLAGSAALATGVLRIKAGEHFISDVMVGVPVGVATGLLVPYLHRNKNKAPRYTILPSYRNKQPGLYAMVNLNN
ncbi:MAG: phosphatase PAP2 family protein [Ferruginibacter sp.]